MTYLRRQDGFSLIPALFLMIVLAGLGAVAVRLSGSQHQTVVLAMQSSRAYAAAQAGVDWSAYQAIVNNNCANSTLTLTEAGLAGFNIETTCSEASYSEGENTVRVITIDSFARGGTYGTPDYVSRRIRATVTDAS